MPVYDDVAADRDYINSLIKKQMGQFSTHMEATFVSAETTDSNLSSILVLGKSMRYVRKLSSVGTMTAGQQLLCVYGAGLPVIIIGVIVGNIDRTP